ncbi:MAG: ShlB/FhaC/HecB family hemolysin secretion/activation protein [Tropicimonas sp.]|uniref:ShlB/FhaC/HecB family hemolysin secretion/activation protein n=1 Tax=Tropicimonas sp. TaxID=2067044 RepID=UPI003A88C80D
MTGTTNGIGTCRPHLVAGTLALVIAAASAAPALAQGTETGVNAGSLQRQINVLERSTPLRRRDAGTVILPGVSVDAIAEVAEDPNAPTLYLSQWQFRGNRLFGTEQLRAVLAGETGRELGFAQIDRAARLIEAWYAQNGYVARVTIPPQEVVGGSVLLEVQEARYAGVAFEGDPPRRVRPEIIERIFNGNVAPGAPLRPEALDRPLLIANGLYGVSLSGALAPGGNPGETVLLLNGVDERPYALEVSLDNFGARSVGELRGSLQAALYSPLRRGDLLLARLTTTEGSPDGEIRYSLPVGLRGARVWADLGYMHYDVTSSDLKALDPTGRSFTRSAGVTFPLLLSRQREVNLTLSHGRDDLRNEVRGETVSDYHITRSTIGLNGRWEDRFLGGGVTRFALAYSTGSAEGEDAGAHFDEDFDIWRLNLDRKQYVTDKVTLMANLSAQKGPRGLDSAEEFFLGGPNGVRAYPIGEGDGPTGATLQLQMAWQVAPNWTVAGFYDHGWIADRTVPGEPGNYQLKGVGAVVSWAHPSGWAAEFTLAHRLGDNPNEIDGGKDQDGSDRDLRAWFELRKTF